MKKALLISCLSLLALACGNERSFNNPPNVEGIYDLKFTSCPNLIDGGLRVDQDGKDIVVITGFMPSFSLDPQGLPGNEPAKLSVKPLGQTKDLGELSMDIDSSDLAGDVDDARHFEVRNEIGDHCEGEISVQGLVTGNCEVSSTECEVRYEKDQLNTDLADFKN